MNDDMTHLPTEQQSVWPPSIKRDIGKSVVPLNKNQTRTLKNRWFYTLMEIVFVWLDHLDYMKYKHITLGQDVAFHGFGSLLFLSLTVRAWVLHHRQRKLTT